MGVRQLPEDHADGVSAMPGRPILAKFKRRCAPCEGRFVAEGLTEEGMWEEAERHTTQHHRLPSEWMKETFEEVE